MSTANRARVFKGALEALQQQTAEMIKQLDLEIAGYDEAKESEYHASDTLYDFDDALVCIAEARNEYTEVAEIETETLVLNWKEQK